MKRDDEIEELKEQFDIEAWIEDQGLTYKAGQGSSGRQLTLKECPSCGDGTWRTYIGAESGLGNCFKCSETWNKLKFVKLVLGDVGWGKVFDEVRRALADQGWRPKKASPAALPPPVAKMPVSFALPTGEGRNLAYLLGRGISNDITAYFHLRMCVMGWWNFTKDDGSPGGQKFDGRLLIPVFDLDGTFVTFQGRDVSGKLDPKYLFPMTLPGTGRYLYNGQNVRDTHRICVGEGAFDVMAQKIAFDADPLTRDVVPVGTFGKHLSYGHDDGNDQLSRFALLKRRGVTEVTLMWDGDAKALVAALDAAKRLRALGFLVRVALLPAGKDPNEVAPEIVRKAFNQATPYTPALDMMWRVKNPYSVVKR